MSAELIGILSVGVALAGLLLALWSRTDKRMDRIEDRMHSGFGEIRAELHQVGERVARLEVLAQIGPAGD